MHDDISCDVYVAGRCSSAGGATSSFVGIFNVDKPIEVQTDVLSS